MNARRTLTFTLCSALFASIQLLFPAATQAQDTSASAEQSLPTVREVLDAYLKATGAANLKDWNAIKSMTLKGKMQIPAAGLSGTMVVYKARPDFSKFEIDLPGMGKSLQGFNGKVGWSMDPARGPSLMSGDQLQLTEREADFDADFNAMEYYDEIKVVGTSEFNGNECYELTFKKGDLTETRYYNTKTHFLDGSKGIYPTEMGKIPVTNLIEVYTKFKDFHIPTKIVMKMAGMDQVMTIESVTLNDVNPSAFDLPPAIKALAEKKTMTNTDGSSHTDSDHSSSSSSSSDSSKSSNSSSSNSNDGSRNSSSSSNSSSSGSRRGG